jgi:tripartite ATP-independent transporter DctM subunit
MSEPIVMGLVGVVVLVLLTGLGIPIAFAITLVGAVGMLISSDVNYTIVTFQTLPFSTASEYAFAVIPMFVLMGAFAAASGIVGELYAAVNRWLEGARGGLYMATAVASAGFAAISGSTVVNAAMFTRIALPEMLQLGYHRGVSAGCIAAAGTFAALIPPSLTFVVFGILTGESIGALFIAGILPGLLTAAFYLLAIPVMMRIKPEWAPPPSHRSTFAEKMKGMRGIWPMLVLVLIVLGGIYTGITPPTAAGAVGAVGALAISLARRRIGLRAIWDCFKQTAELTSVLFIIIIGGILFSRFLVVSGFITDLTDLVTASGLTAPMFILTIVVMYVIMGMFIDPLSMLVMTVPFIYPVIISFGMDPIWFGVVTVKLIEIAVITPPVGINLFAVVSAADGRVSTADLFFGVLPFVLIECIVLLLLVLFPAISTWLPATMM